MLQFHSFEWVPLVVSISIWSALSSSASFHRTFISVTKVQYLQLTAESYNVVVIVPVVLILIYFSFFFLLHLFCFTPSFALALLVLIDSKQKTCPFHVFSSSLRTNSIPTGTTNAKGYWPHLQKIPH